MISRAIQIPAVPHLTQLLGQKYFQGLEEVTLSSLEEAEVLARGPSCEASSTFNLQDEATAVLSAVNKFLQTDPTLSPTFIAREDILARQAHSATRKKTLAAGILLGGTAAALGQIVFPGPGLLAGALGVTTGLLSYPALYQKEKQARITAFAPESSCSLPKSNTVVIDLQSQQPLRDLIAYEYVRFLQRMTSDEFGVLSGGALVLATGHARGIQRHLARTNKQQHPYDYAHRIFSDTSDLLEIYRWMCLITGRPIDPFIEDLQEHLTEHLPDPQKQDAALGTALFTVLEKEWSASIYRSFMGRDFGFLRERIRHHAWVS